ncbi:putative 4'-phosphopantetheinyl transferase [Candidatus Nitrospira nitrosa]|uniref:Putative 4'-phosphopantetheinyl transferase n=1 Tax=Candidatus Nitrospira nitrosa TaxID=1742972 RepID=A0A0S4LJR7_9BACT|nr:4'-phosphopantetheinyl transferase superfamily protein [Candidatus Nitrospira nitrosa]CUS36986.1 putative 4'-phosphopantetheinyl transferase [Candidatus Nitrospira nitrosa]
MNAITAERPDNSTRPTPASLMDGDVHVWCADLRERWPESVLYELLSEEERTRASRFAFEEDRRRYVHAHGLLRILLGRYLGRSPASIQFMIGCHGKPCLRSENETMHFNLSHARALVLCAFARDREVGIDVEWRDRELSWHDVAEYTCSKREQAILSSLVGPAQVDTFYSWWTLKEAYIKAVGVGLTLPLNQIEVAGRCGAQVPTPADGDIRDPRWAMLTLPLWSEYAGALVTEGHAARIRCFQWGWDSAEVLAAGSDTSCGEGEVYHARQS